MSDTNEVTGCIDLWLPCRDESLTAAREVFMESIADVLPKSRERLKRDETPENEAEAESSDNEEIFFEPPCMDDESTLRYIETRAEVERLRDEHRILEPSPHAQPCEETQGKIPVIGGDLLKSPQFSDPDAKLSAFVVSSHGQYLAFASGGEIGFCETKTGNIQQLIVPEPPSAGETITSIRFFYDDEDSSALIYTAGQHCWGWDPMHPKHKKGDSSFMCVSASSGDIIDFSHCHEHEGRSPAELLLLATDAKIVDIWVLSAYENEVPILLQSFNIGNTIRSALLIVDSAAVVAVVASEGSDGYLCLDTKEVRNPSCHQASLKPSNVNGERALGCCASLTYGRKQNLVALGIAGGRIEVYCTSDYLGYDAPARADTICTSDNTSPHIAWCGPQPILAASSLAHEVIVFRYFRGQDQLQLLNVLRCVGNLVPPLAIAWASDEGLLIAAHASEFQFWVLELDEFLSNEEEVEQVRNDGALAGDDLFARMQESMVVEEEERVSEGDEEEEEDELRDIDLEAEPPTIFVGAEDDSEDEGAEDEDGGAKDDSVLHLSHTT